MAWRSHFSVSNYCGSGNRVLHVESVGYTILMKLADYMHKHNLTPEQIRRMLGVRSRSTVLRYINHERRPAPDLMDKIEKITNDEVTRVDFDDTSPPNCLRVVIDWRGNEQKVYPWTAIEQRSSRRKVANDNRRAQQRQTNRRWGREIDKDKWPSPPLQRAIVILGGRAVHARRGGFLLDGRKVDAKRIVAEANRVLRKRGLDQIPYPGVYRPEGD